MEEIMILMSQNKLTYIEANRKYSIGIQTYIKLKKLLQDYSFGTLLQT